MFKKTIKATFLCLAFAQSADAGGIMPNFSNDPTPETAYSTLNNSDSCLLASEALNSKDIDLTEDQKLIADLALEVQTTDLGAIVTQKIQMIMFFTVFGMTMIVTPMETRVAIYLT